MSPQLRHIAAQSQSASCPQLAAGFDRQRHDGLRDNSSGQGYHGADAPQRAAVIPNIHCASIGSHLRVEEDLVDQLFNSSEKHLARALLLLANFGKDGRQEPVIAKVSQETLADMVGTTRSCVNHFMNRFRRLGYINYNGDLEVHSSLMDAVLHEKPQTIKAPRRAVLNTKKMPR